MRHLPPSVKDPSVLVGLESPDHAGVYKITDEVAIVQTVDFFTPIVDPGGCDLRFSRSHIDHADADRDPNCLFPLTPAP